MYCNFGYDYGNGCGNNGGPREGGDDEKGLNNMSGPYIRKIWCQLILLNVSLFLLKVEIKQI